MSRDVPSEPELHLTDVARLVGARPATNVDATELEALSLPRAPDPDEDTQATKREGATKPKLDPEEKLPRGANVGRYVVLDVVGEGGMGVVYSAYDPELDRKLAIKLLQARPASGSSSTGEQAWLLREAQALARLSHPNVVAVHDVGSLPGDRVFVAIELVEGITLRAWLEAKPRSWRDVRRVMLDAGAGLAAAHRAGLVHRDFKPENVIVGNDGRVRVMDFGLARLSTADDGTPIARGSAVSIDASPSPLSESLTVAGTAVGTPAYMAPEVFDGQIASERSDQFAFGVTLYEALYQTRPFEKKALMAPRAPGLAAKPPPRRSAPQGYLLGWRLAGVPARLARIAMRAIALPPGDRFASMDALLAELSIDPMAMRKRAALAGGACAVATGLVVAGKLASAAPQEAPVLVCKDAERHLAGVWDDGVKQTIRAAFAKTTRPSQAHAYTQVAAALDKYAGEWTAAVTDSCEATQIRFEQAAEVQSLRQDCFEQRRQELGAFARLLGEADDALVDKAPTGVANLEPVKRCADVAALKAPAQPTPAMRPQLEPLNLLLADAKAGFMAGNLGRAINKANEASEAARKIGFDPLLAECQLVHGMALVQVGNGADGLTALTEATWAGLRGHRDDVAAAAALYAALATAENLNKQGEAAMWVALGTAVAKRVPGDRQRAFELQRLELEGIVSANKGDLITATKAHTQALEMAIQIYGRDGTLVARNEQLLGATLSRAGDYAHAKPHYLRALDLTRTFLGPDHPDVALMLSGLASTYHYTDEPEKSREAFDRAIAIRERVFGTNSPVLIPTLNNYAELYRDENDPAKGLPLAARAKAITLATVGRGHPYFVVTTSTHGDLLLLAGRVAEARKELDEVVRVGEQTKSIYLASVLASRAKLARFDKKWSDAAALDLRAIALFEASVGKDAPEMWRSLAGLADTRIAQGKPAEARPLLERAIAIAEKAKVPERLLAPTRAKLE